MRKTDKNGFITYENVTFIKEGVFKYLGKEIDPTGKYGTNPNAVYSVYRPKAEIAKKEFIESLNQKPIVDDHTVIGNKAGMVKPEDKNCGGVLSNVQLVGNELHGRIDIWSTKLIEEIDGNKRELSLCYLCDYKPQKGEFEGEKYDFIQSGLECGNHLALVDEARNGHECRVMDSMYACDARINLQGLEREVSDMDLSKLSADELVEAIKGCSDECKAKVKDFLNTPTEDEKKAAEEKAKKEAEEKAAKDAAEAEAAKKAEEEAKAKKEAEDAEAAKKAEEEKAAACDKAIAEYKKALTLANDISTKAKDIFGTVTCDGVSTELALAEKVCAMTCDNMPAALKGLKGDIAVATLKGFLANCQTSKDTKTVVSDTNTTKKSFADYLGSL